MYFDFVLFFHVILIEFSESFTSPLTLHASVVRIFPVTCFSPRRLFLLWLSSWNPPTQVHTDPAGQFFSHWQIKKKTCGRRPPGGSPEWCVSGQLAAVETRHRWSFDSVKRKNKIRLWARVQTCFRLGYLLADFFVFQELSNETKFDQI